MTKMHAAAVTVAVLCVTSSATAHVVGACPEMDDCDLSAERQLTMRRRELIHVEDLAAGGLKTLEPFAVPRRRAALEVLSARDGLQDAST